MLAILPMKITYEFVEIQSATALQWNRADRTKSPIRKRQVTELYETFLVWPIKITHE